MLQGKTILLTGGAGFIGVKLAERLCAHNALETLEVDYLGTSNLLKAASANAA